MQGRKISRARNGDEKSADENALTAEKTGVAEVEEDEYAIPKYNSWAEKARIFVPICLLISFQQGLSQFGVILDNLQSYFPDASQTMIQMVIAAPSVTAIPVSLLSGLFATFMSRKKIGIMALFFMLVGGIIPIFLHTDIIYLFISSGLIGIAQGFIITTSTGMFAENFEGSDRDFAMGLKQVTDSVGNTIIALLAGWLCTVAWQYSYSVYLLVIPIIFLVWKYLPEGRTDRKIYSKREGFKGIAFLRDPQFLFMCLFMMFCGFSVYAMYMNGAMSAAEKGLGGAQLTAIVFSVSNILTLVFGLTYMPIAKVLKKFALATAMLLMVVAYAIFYFATSVPMFIFGGVVWGIANSLLQSASLVFLSNSLPHGSYGLGLAIGNAMINVGVVAAPFVMSGLSLLFFGAEGATNAFFTAIVVCGIAFALEVGREILFGNRSTVE